MYKKNARLDQFPTGKHQKNAIVPNKTLAKFPSHTVLKQWNFNNFIFQDLSISSPQNWQWEKQWPYLYCTGRRVILLYSWPKHVTPTVALSTGELSGRPDEILEGKVAIDRHLIQRERLEEGEGGGNNNPSRFSWGNRKKPLFTYFVNISRASSSYDFFCSWVRLSIDSNFIKACKDTETNLT